MTAWSNSELATARRTKTNFQDMEASWREQRLWGVQQYDACEKNRKFFTMHDWKQIHVNFCAHACRDIPGSFS